jgi:hypothetical protein
VSDVSDTDHADITYMQVLLEINIMAAMATKAGRGKLMVFQWVQGMSLLEEGMSFTVPTHAPPPLNHVLSHLNAMLMTRRFILILFYHVRFEVFMAVTMKNGVFWDVTQCAS